MAARDEEERNIEELSIALVREYLNKKGYRSTLASLDKEAPRTEHSISSRSVLTRDLGISHLVKRNKGLTRPYKTTIEVIVHNFVSSNPSKKDMPLDGNPITTLPGTASRKDTPLDGNPITMLPGTASRKDTPLGSNPITMLPGTANPTKLKETTRRSIQLEELSGHLPSHPEVTKAQQVLQEMTRSHLVDTTSNQTETKIKTGGSHMEGIMWEDLEDINSYIDDAKPLSVHSPVIKSTGDHISSLTAEKLRQVVFGTAAGPSFNEEWRSQGFVFNTIPSLNYGLVQYKGGPCGVLACVQAYILKSLLFADGAHTTNDAIPSQLSVLLQKELLVTALSEILWKAGEKKRATVALKPWQRLNKVTPIKSKSYWPDQLTEQLMIHTFSDYNSLKEFINHHFSQFNSTNKDNAGCIVYLYSVILSRGIEKLQDDFDDPTSTLIGAHGYCTQELISLFLTGIGTSNAFDGDIIMDSQESTSSHTLKGIKSQSQIGYLSLFEHYGHCKIGEYFKNPSYPIWVICSESHFTVLFSSSINISTKFIRLHYYDGLCNFPEPIIFTIDSSATTRLVTSDPPSSDPSPLELCIKTKWNQAVVGCSHDGMF